jgi:hypothetical protein
MFACAAQLPASSAPPTAADDPTTKDPGAACIAAAEAPRTPAVDAPSRVGVKHVLVKFAGADRAAASISRSRSNACLRALEALEAMKAGADFDEVVTRYSDEDGAASRAGALGTIAKDDVDPAFAAAAFALDINAVSHVVATKFGFHIILRTQ